MLVLVPLNQFVLLELHHLGVHRDGWDGAGLQDGRDGAGFRDGWDGAGLRDGWDGASLRDRGQPTRQVTPLVVVEHTLELASGEYTPEEAGALHA